MKKSEVTPIFPPCDKPMSVAVLLSGSGTNFVALYEEQKRLEKKGEKNFGRIDVVFTNVPNCRGAQLAEEYGIPVARLSSKKFFEFLDKEPNDEQVRDSYDAAAIVNIEEVCDPDLIGLAGYRRRLGSPFHKRFKNKIINLYPGDITKDYLTRGVEACVQAMRAGEDSIKCTVYLEKENERFGPAILQSKPISLAGFKESDKERVNEIIRDEGEWKIYPFAVHNLIAKGCIEFDEDVNVYLEGVRMDRSGLQFGS
jgi:phosphoribosylglycinamide formyltransferase-1